MKDFLLLFIGGEPPTDASPEQMQQTMQRWFEWIGRMREAGIYKGGHPLEAEGRTIHGAEKIVADGPFAEAKELVGGYMLLHVAGMDDAVKWARGCPIFDAGGRVEVRPIQAIEGL